MTDHEGSQQPRSQERRSAGNEVAFPGRQFQLQSQGFFSLDVQLGSFFLSFLFQVEREEALGSRLVNYNLEVKNPSEERGCPAVPVIKIFQIKEFGEL